MSSRDFENTTADESTMIREPARMRFRKHGSGVSAPFQFTSHSYSSNRLIGIQNRVSVTMRSGALK
jgi:hypothetical protein